MRSNNTIDVIGLAQVTGSGYAKHVIEGAGARSIGVSTGRGINGNLLEQYELSPDGMCHLAASDRMFICHIRECLIATDVTNGSLEARESLELGLSVISGLDTAIASGNHITIVISLARAAISEAIARLIHEVETLTRLLEHGCVIIQSHFSVIGNLSQPTQTQAIVATNKLYGKQLIDRVRSLAMRANDSN